MGAGMGDEQGVAAAIALAIPLLLTGSALFGGGRTANGQLGRAGEAPWQRAERLAAGVFALACLAAGLELGRAIGWIAVPSAWPVVVGAPAVSPLGLVRIDALTLTMLLLVTGVAWLIVRFSRRTLDGDPAARRYLRWLQATVAAVTLLVVTDHLLILAGAWIATSLALHQLLTHFEDRPAALIAAHKKFIASRVAEVCALVAIGLIASRVGSFSVTQLLAWLEAHPADRRLEAAAVLLAAAAALKCAQMPFHGWLIQVMEAPTPVSALLHAGVVNIGGFLMLRLAPLLAGAEAAQLLLVVWGSLNAVVAALVMTTRVSTKVALAWSTCAQMGFMLLECGLGAWSLALLHLVAHSLYKAHAFLAAGSVVEQYRIEALLPRKGAMPLRRWLGALPLALLATLPVALLFGLDPRREPSLAVLGPIFVLALAPLVAGGLAGGAGRLAFALAASVGLALLYAVGHAGFGALLDWPASPVSAARIAIALTAFGLLFGVQGWIAARPDGRLARALYPRLFAGLYLDDLFTRLTFRLWPARMPGAPVDRPVGIMPR
ncbi:MAG: NADH-quinone oxidoreductase subunit L [Myxococcota bacterium]